ncbi:MAG: hypothetical protein U9R53_10940 [Chloroflexota bacterium]|nr:hypothetical protein [Chloroflexota bacterium]
MTESAKFLEIFQSFILPAAGAVGGLAALIMFLLSESQRRAEMEKIKAETEKVEAEKNHTLRSTEATLTKITSEAAAHAIEGQRILIDDLQERLKMVILKVSDLKCLREERGIIIKKLDEKVTRLEKELDVREANIVALEDKLRRYEAENQEYRKENEQLRKQVESQRLRIKELEDQIKEIKRKYQEAYDG